MYNVRAMKTVAQDTVSQIAVRNCSEEAGEEPGNTCAPAYVSVKD